MTNTDTTRKPGVNPGARKGQADRVSYKTPAMLIMQSSPIKDILQEG